MREGHFSGVIDKHVFYEDFAVLESMGPIVDRTRENLKHTDASVVLARREWLQAARHAEAGKPAWGLADEIDYARIRTIILALAEQTDWRRVNPFEPDLGLSA